MGDILIHGMEMPSMGYREIRIHPNGTVTERLDRCEVTVGKAVPVPPHGRLGDLDTLKVKAIERSEKCGVLVNVLDNVITAYDIETAPTIIPASEEDQGKNI